MADLDLNGRRVLLTGTSTGILAPAPPFNSVLSQIQLRPSGRAV
jgi:hypothetical protein